MQVCFEKSFQRDLKKVKSKKILQAVKEIIDKVEKANNLEEIGSVVKLRGYRGYYRIRTGDYRIGIEVWSSPIFPVKRKSPCN